MEIIYSIVESLAKRLRENYWTRRLLYNPVKNAARHRVGTFKYMLHYLDQNREIGEPLPDAFKDPMIGILKDPFHFHEPYMSACLDLRVGYRVIDLFAEDWISQINESGCKLFLVWPSESIAEWKKLYDDRLRFIVEHMGLRIYPDLTACWLYGSKERQSVWLELNGFDHPKCWNFFSEEEALSFVRSYQYSAGGLVGKTDIGATASGVRILRSGSEAEKYVRRAFARGIRGYYADWQTLQWRHVFFQEYLQNAKEWRVHRLGNSFFGFGKLKRGDFHSGSGLTDWRMPPQKALDLAWSITEKGGFRSMAMDIFETTDGRFLVNELQCVYGQHGAVQLVMDGVSGRLLREADGTWQFEEGIFADLHGCRLRVKAALGIE